MEINISDIEDVIVCDCGVVLKKDKVLKEPKESYECKKGKCPCCKKELVYYGDD